MEEDVVLVTFFVTPLGETEYRVRVDEIVAEVGILTLRLAVIFELVEVTLSIALVAILQRNTGTPLKCTTVSEGAADAWANAGMDMEVIDRIITKTNANAFAFFILRSSR